MFVNRAILHPGRRGFSQVQQVLRSTAVVNELVEINTAAQFKDYLQKQEDGLSIFARNGDEVYARRFELAKLRRKASLSIPFPDNQSLYSLASNTFYCFDEKGKSRDYFDQVALSFFASLFSDRHGHIYNMTSDSVSASLLMNLYSAFNRVVLSPNDYQSSATTTAMNCIQSHTLQMSEESMQSVQTIFYRIPSNSISIPPFPKEKDKITAMEAKIGITKYYEMIEKAYSILKSSRLSKERRRQVPVESALYIICPSLLLPYFYNHYTNTPVLFNHFCCSLLTTSEISSNLSKKQASSAQLLIRAYINSDDDGEEEEEEEEEEEGEDGEEDGEEVEEGDDVGLDEETLAEIVQMEEIEGNETIEIEVEEEDGEKKDIANQKVEFHQFPRLSIYDQNGELAQDVQEFTSILPAYKSFDSSQ